MDKRRRAIEVLIVTGFGFSIGPEALAGGNREASLRIPQALAPGSPPASDFKVTLLGTGTPARVPIGSVPAHWWKRERRDSSSIADGPSTTRLWQLNIPPGMVKLFVSHLHSDHIVGIPDLWLTGWSLMRYGGRRDVFRVSGRKGTVEMMSYLEKAYQEDIRIRREFSPAITAEQMAIAAKDFTEGVVYGGNGVRVTAFRVKAWRAQGCLRVSRGLQGPIVGDFR